MVTMSRINAANIGRRYHRIRLKDIDKTSSQYESLLAWVADMHTLVADGMGLILQGSDGVGKTAAASRLLMEGMARGPIKTYFIASGNLDHYAINRRETNQNEDSIWDLMTRDAAILVIDDLAAERKTEWTSRWIETVLSERYSRQLSTIITTNPPEDEEVFTRYPRLKQLSKDAYKLIKFDGENMRG
jgi:DNA replication protein DnaC